MQDWFSKLVYYPLLGTGLYPKDNTFRSKILKFMLFVLFVLIFPLAVKKCTDNLTDIDSFALGFVSITIMTQVTQICISTCTIIQK